MTLGATSVPIDPVTIDAGWLAGTLTALVEANQVPGAQLAVHSAGRTVAVEIGHLEHGTAIPVTRDTAFPIGSISKAWTATLAMILVADGDLELDAPLEEHLPALGELGRLLTLEHLLSHTSGLPSSPEIPGLVNLSLPCYVRDHCRVRDLIFPPGTGFSYSTRNYVLVAHLIETITGMSWLEAVESILLRPLGIEATTVGATARARCGRPVATGHSVNAAVGRIRPVNQSSLVAAEAPAGALAMSAVDLVALGLLHTGPGVPELLPAPHAAQMRRAIPGADPFGLADGWGAGLAVFRHAGREWVGHDGNANGTACYLRIDPANAVVVALTTNASTGSYLWEDLGAELGKVKLPLGAQRCGVPRQRPAAPPPGCAGSYSNSSTEYLVIAGDDGHMYLANGDELLARLAFHDEMVFALQDLASGRELHRGRFLRDSTTGQVDHLQIGGRLARRTHPPAEPATRYPADPLSRQPA
ncbi:MAG TPA: serine hydrolase domain-containing protein [Pseudonocardiaceae bacterium]|nr:serine hydrolase domain-containing protein [Pseudonocardiaceae bacterium]